MKARWLYVGIPLAIGILALAILFGSGLSTIADSPPLRGLVLTDVGPYEDVVGCLQAFGWQVTTANVLESMAMGSEGLAGYDAVWIPAQENYPALRHFVNEGGVLDFYTKSGGIVILCHLTPDGFWIDMAPGGLDARPKPSEGAGTVTIADPTHPVITGEGIEGVPLTDEDLDPEGNGGGGCVLFPQDGNAITLATNDLGSVLLDYRYGDGYVFICALCNQRNCCNENILKYIQSLAR